MYIGNHFHVALNNRLPCDKYISLNGPPFISLVDDFLMVYIKVAMRCIIVMLGFLLDVQRWFIVCYLLA